MDNPAKLSTGLESLFPAGAVAAELIADQAPLTLLEPAELHFISHCADKRIKDFTRGRACAHRVLCELGIRGFPLLAGASREPLWPDSIVGSITHTYGYAAAVAARQSKLRGIGIDCEVIDSVDEELWPRICTVAEQQRLARLQPPERTRLAALLFAAKEAFYKCQFPLTRKWVGFEDVLIEPLEWPAMAAGLRIVAQTSLPLEPARLATLVGRFQFQGPRVIAGVSVAD